MDIASQDDRSSILLSSLLLSRLGFSDTQSLRAFQIRSRLGTAAHLCEVVVFKLITVPIDTAIEQQLPMRGGSPQSSENPLLLN